MNSDLSNLIINSKYRLVWEAIASDRVSQVPALMNEEGSRKGLLRFFRKPSVYPAALYAVKDLVRGKSSGRYFSHLSITHNGEEEFVEMVRAAYVLRSHPRYQQEAVVMAGHAVHTLAVFSDEIWALTEGAVAGKQAAGYKRTGVIVRDWSGPLAAFFEMSGDAQNKAAVLYHRCRITTAIMEGYPQYIAPDMIAVAVAFAATGRKEEAVKFYEAVITDYGTLPAHLLAQPGEPLAADTRLVIVALRDAYIGLQALTGFQGAAGNLAEVETLLKREAVVRKV